MTLAGFILYAIGGAICWAFPANMTVIAVAMVGICTGIFNGLLGHAGYIAPEIVNGVTVAAEQSAAVKGVITFGFVGLEVFTGVILAALLTFFPEIALHITRPVRWDSDHVVLFDDETKELCKEIVRCGGLDGRVYLALDYFDASVNRIAAWVTGFRNVQKALLNALLTPDMTAEQNAGNFTDLLVRQEELKTMPFGEVWAEYCRRCGVPEDGAWLPLVWAYEKNILEARA